MRIGVLLPTRSMVMVDARRPRTEVTWAMVDHAEEAGYEHVWVGDSIVAKPRHEPLITLAFAAGRTRRIRLGTAVLLPALRHPVVLANELASLDHVSRGRLIVGVAPGWGMPSAAAEMAAVGARVTERGRRLEEHLEVWRELWSGRPVTRSGTDFELVEHSIGPLPWREDGPEVWVTAGNRGELLPRAFQRFARHGAGIITTDVGPAECVEIRRRGEAALAETDRELGDFPLGVYVTVRLDDDRASAERRHAEFMAAYYGPQAGHQRGTAAVGAAEDVRAALAPLALAGVTDLIVRFAGPDQLEQLERFTAEVRRDLALGGLVAALEERAGEKGWGDSPEGLMHLQSVALALAPEAGLDLESAHAHARTFIDNFPPMSLPFGDVDQRAARWLAQLLDQGGVRPRLRHSLQGLGAAWQGPAPVAARQLEAWSAGPPPADPREDLPWLQALVALARTELAG